MNEINVVTVGNATHRVSSFSYPPQLPTITEFKDFSKEVYSHLVNNENFDLRTSSRSEEFLAYALVGAPGGGRYSASRMEFSWAGRNVWTPMWCARCSNPLLFLTQYTLPPITMKMSMC